MTIGRKPQSPFTREVPAGSGSGGATELVAAENSPTGRARRGPSVNAIENGYRSLTVEMLARLGPRSAPNRGCCCAPGTRARYAVAIRRGG